MLSMPSGFGYPGMGYTLGASAAESALQRAVVALGMLVNDARLALKVDGVVGPGTAAAVNRAMATYVTSAPAAARTGKLTVATIKAQAPALTSLIGQEVGRRQAKAPARAPVAKGPAAPPASQVATATLQRAVATLGAQRNDATLKIAADGKIGPKTVAAVNRALTRYVSGAPANMRTGNLSTAQVQSNAAIIATYVEREIAAFKARPPGAVAAAGPSKASGMALQNALRALGNVTKDAVLKVAADGIIGPRTLTAVNRALTAYLGKPATNMASVQANAVALASIIATEAKRRGAAPRPAPGPAAAVPGGTANLTVARMQRALRDLGALIGDRTLQITADGIVGPKTTTAVNKTFRAYIKTGPAALRQKLSPGQVAAMADVITAQVEKAVSDRRATAARQQAKGEAPAPEAVPDTPVEAVEAQAPAAAPEPAPAPIPGPTPVPFGPAPVAQEPAPAPTPTVPSEPSYYTPPAAVPSAPAADMAPPSAMMPPSAVPSAADQEVAPTPGADMPAPTEKKKFPWIWVGVGVGVAGIGTLAIILLSKKKPRRTLRPATA